MQGVAAHIEYIKKNCDTVDFVNCKFWKNGICYNTLSTKYGEACYSKRGCMYSIPLPNGSKQKVNKKNDTKYKKDKVNIPTIIYTHRVSDIKRNYFNEDIITTVKVDHKSYKVQCKYNSGNDKLLFIIWYKTDSKTYVINCNLILSKAIKISDNKVIFTVKIEDIVNEMKSIKEYRVADFIKEQNKSNIIRKAIVSDNKDVTNKIDSLIKFTAYVIIKGFMEIY